MLAESGPGSPSEANDQPRPECRTVVHLRTHAFDSGQVQSMDRSLRSRNSVERIDLDQTLVLAVKVLYSPCTRSSPEATMQTLYYDLRFALRQLAKAPGMA